MISGLIVQKWSRGASGFLELGTFLEHFTYVDRRCDVIVVKRVKTQKFFLACRLSPQICAPELYYRASSASLRYNMHFCSYKTALIFLYVYTT